MSSWTLGINDFISPVLDDPEVGVDTCFVPEDVPENLGMKLFFSWLGAGDLARGEGARLLPTGGVFG